MFPERLAWVDPIRSDRSQEHCYTTERRVSSDLVRAVRAEGGWRKYAAIDRRAWMTNFQLVERGCATIKKETWGGVLDAAMKLPRDIYTEVVRFLVE